MRPITKVDIVPLLKHSLAELTFQANEIRRKFTDSRLELCNIINAKSGLCRQDCKFCAQSLRYSTNISTYPLKNKKQIIEAAKRAKEIGASRFGIVTSGQCISYREEEIIKEAVREIADKVGILVCASLGSLKRQQLKALKKAGLSRYHHNIETSPHFYPQIVSTHSFAQRIGTIKAAKEVGLEVCSGGIIGMGESWEDRMEMARILKDLDVDSVPINFFVPIKGTPLQNLAPISSSDALRTLSIFRIILPDKIIKIAAGRETILKDSQILGFMAGASGMLIGGYLTIKGQGIEKDRRLVKAVENLWKA